MAPFTNPSQIGGVGWILATTWMPYQLSSFVTPPFPGLASGHSTFSRSAAEVLTMLTGTPYFPGGLGEYDIHTGLWIAVRIWTNHGFSRCNGRPISTPRIRRRSRGFTAEFIPRMTIFPVDRSATLLARKLGNWPCNTSMAPPCPSLQRSRNHC